MTKFQGTEMDNGDGGFGTEIEPVVRGTELEGGVPESNRAIRRTLPEPLAERYEITALLGRGSQAEVYRAMDRTTSSSVAIKLYTTPNHRLNKEVVALIESADPADIIPTTFGSWGDEQWEIQELIQFGSAADLPAEKSPEFLVEVVRELSDAVTHAHQRKLIHRDIKPTNILVRSLEPLDLVLADFGLARELIAGAEVGSTSHSVGYAAPEALRGEHDFPSDWWAVGITLFEIAQGRYPFTSPNGMRWNDARIVAHLLDGEVDVSSLDDRWQLLMRGLLTKDPGRRWSGVEVAEWVAGKSPAVHAAVVKGWSFVAPNWDTFESTQQLGDALVDDWKGASRWLSGRASQVESMSVALSKSPHEEEASRLFDRFSRGQLKVDALVFELGQLLAPHRPISFQGVPLTAEGLGNEASKAVEGSGEAGDWIRSLRDLGILRNTGHHPDHAALVNVDSKLADYWEETAADVVLLEQEQASEFREEESSEVPAEPASIGGVVDGNRNYLEGEFLRVALSDEYRAAVHQTALTMLDRGQSMEWMRLLTDRVRGERGVAVDVLYPILVPVAQADSAAISAAAAERQRRARADLRARHREVRGEQTRIDLKGLLAIAVVYSFGAAMGAAVHAEPAFGANGTLPWSNLFVSLGTALVVSAILVGASDMILGRPDPAWFAVSLAVAGGLSWGNMSWDMRDWGEPAIWAAGSYLVAALCSRALPVQNFAGLSAPLSPRMVSAFKIVPFSIVLLLPVSLATMLWTTTTATMSFMGNGIWEAQTQAFAWLGPVYDVFGDGQRFPFETVSWAIPSGLLAVVLLGRDGRNRIEAALLVASLVGLASSAVLLWTLYVTAFPFWIVLMIVGVVALGAVL